jgi:hypothetical protein
MKQLIAREAVSMQRFYDGCALWQKRLEQHMLTLPSSTFLP